MERLLLDMIARDGNGDVGTNNNSKPFEEAPQMRLTEVSRLLAEMQKDFAKADVIVDGSHVMHELRTRKGKRGREEERIGKPEDLAKFRDLQERFAAAAAEISRVGLALVRMHSHFGREEMRSTGAKRARKNAHCEHCPGKPSECACEAGCRRKDTARCTARSVDHCMHCCGLDDRCTCEDGCPRPAGSLCTPRHCRHCEGGRGDCECARGCPRAPGLDCRAQERRPAPPPVAV